MTSTASSMAPGDPPSGAPNPEMELSDTANSKPPPTTIANPIRRCFMAGYRLVHLPFCLNFASPYQVRSVMYFSRRKVLNGNRMPAVAIVRIR